MQKLEERNTYTPMDIPHIRSNFETPIISKYLNGVSNCDLSLNREETLSVAGLKTSSNNSDAALTATEYAGQDLRVPVIVIRATESGIRLPIRYSVTYYICGRGTLPHTLKSVVSAIPAPHGVL